MLYLLFFLTGAAGLIYEISWSRQIGIFFGHTVNAAAVVLAAYFGGMALGYWLAARWSTHSQRPLRGYALCELAVAVWAVLTPLILSLFKLPGLAALLNSDSEALQTGARVIAALLVLLPATIALGATLPFVAQHLARQAGDSEAGRSNTTLAYSLNTAGAVAGVLLATFVLILQLGVTHSSYLAAGISALCGLGAWWLSGQHSASSSKQAESAPDLNESEAFKTSALSASSLERTATQWYWLAAISGFGTLALQVLYVRLFAMVFNNSTYTFGGIVAVFLLCLALGGWLVARYCRLALAPRWAAWACLLGGLAIPSSLLLFQRLTMLRYFSSPGGFWEYIFSALGLIAIVLCLPVTLLALILPAAWAAAVPSSTKGEGLGAVVGRLTALNTLSATLGSLLASFILMPMLGIWASFWVVACLYLLSGGFLLRRYEPRIKGWKLGLSLTLVPAVFTLLCWATNLDLVREAPKKGYHYLYLKDTAYGRIDVLEKDKTSARQLRQNRHYTLGGSAGDDTERFQGLLPLLLHPAPKQVCFLGLATGITASSAILDPRVEQATAVELIPEVAAAADYFSAHNADFLHNPRAKVKINDARYYLYATPDKYDVIVSDLFVPWHSQTGYLYTVEHYQAARRRLAPGGIFCQWLPLYQLGPRELELIMDSFATVFPHTSLWRGELWDSNFGTLALIGSEEAMPVSLSRLRESGRALESPAKGDKLAQSFYSDPARAYLGDWTPGGFGSHRMPEGNWPLNTDEHPRVEFLAPLSHGDEHLLTAKLWTSYREAELSSLPHENVVFEPSP